jgi:shikimate dehydrogenase
MTESIITATTTLCGVLGNPVEHSLSPLIHNAAFAHMKLDYVFLAFKVTELREAVMGVRGLGLRGVSVTIPHKVEIMDYLDGVDKGAQDIGAVNTVINQDGRLIGYNTDCEGAISPLVEKMELSGMRVALLGAGGAARAIAYGLKERGVDLTILNRTVKKADTLAKELGCRSGGLSHIGSLKPEILINTTSLGMYPQIDTTPVPRELLKGMLVYDIVYNPLKTRLLREAEENGCDTIPGVEMFVNQAALQFELWTGKKAPREVMKRCVMGRLS